VPNRREVDKLRKMVTEATAHSKSNEAMIQTIRHYLEEHKKYSEAALATIRQFIEGRDSAADTVRQILFGHEKYSRETYAKLHADLNYTASASHKLTDFFYQLKDQVDAVCEQSEATAEGGD